MQEKIISGRIYKGSTAQIEVQLFQCGVEPDMTDFHLYFFTDGAHTLDKTDAATIEGNIATVVFTKEDLDIMNDGVLRYHSEADGIVFETNTKWYLSTPKEYTPSVYPTVDEIEGIVDEKVTEAMIDYPTKTDVEEIVGERLIDYYTKEEIDAKGVAKMVDILSEDWDREHPENYRFYYYNNTMNTNEIGRSGNYVYFNSILSDGRVDSVYRVHYKGSVRQYWLPVTYTIDSRTDYTQLKNRLEQEGVVYGQRDNVKLLYNNGGAQFETVYLGYNTFYNQFPETSGEHKGKYLFLDFDFTQDSWEDAITERYVDAPYATTGYVDTKFEEVEGKIPDVSNFATKDELNDKVSEEVFDNYKSEISTALGDKADKTEIPDISGLATKTELEAVEDKIPSIDGLASEAWVAEQGFLTEHQTLKTINGESVVGEGNIEIQGGGESYNGNIILGGSSETEPYMREQNKKVWDMLEAGTYRGGFLVQVGTGGTYSVSVLTNWFKAMGKYTFTAEYFNGSTQQMFYNSVSLWEDNASLSAYNSLSVQKQITAGTNISIDNKNKINCTIDTTGFATKEEIPDVSGFATKDEIPSLDGYATETWVENKGYLTEHQTLKTINGESVVGEGNIEIHGGEGDYLPLSGGTITGGLHVEGDALVVGGENVIDSGKRIKVIRNVNGTTLIEGNFLVQNAMEIGFKHIYNNTEDAYFLLDGTGLKLRCSGKNGDSVTKGKEGVVLSTQNTKTIGGTSINGTGDIPVVKNVQNVTGIWKGTQAQYDAITTKSDNTVYIIVG